jgi:hypothetical protein
MLSKCANPKCTAQLRYLQEGQLFVIWPVGSIIVAESHIQYLWLCGSCCRRMTVTGEANVKFFPDGEVLRNGELQPSTMMGDGRHPDAEPKPARIA